MKLKKQIRKCNKQKIDYFDMFIVLGSFYYHKTIEWIEINYSLRKIRIKEKNRLIVVKSDFVTINDKTEAQKQQRLMPIIIRLLLLDLITQENEV